MLHGQGSYTKQERDVLMIAVTTTEMQHLKALVHAEDPNAFMIVTPALEIIGRGFKPMVVGIESPHKGIRDRRSRASILVRQDQITLYATSGRPQLRCEGLQSFVRFRQRLSFCVRQHELLEGAHASEGSQHVLHHGLLAGDLAGWLLRREVVGQILLKPAGPLLNMMPTQVRFRRLQRG